MSVWAKAMVAAKKAVNPPASATRRRASLDQKSPSK
jgi:hypothetical protein